MPRNDTTHCTATVEQLYAERRSYVRRLADLGGDPNSAGEIDACLHQIETVNAALLDIAKQTADRETWASWQSGAAHATSYDRT